MSPKRTLPTLIALASFCIGFCIGLPAFAQSPTPVEPSETVNINTADAETIARVLNGVGLAKARAIIEHREQHGRFDAPADLAKVKGIGEATVAKNAARIIVSSGGAARGDPAMAAGDS